MMTKMSILAAVAALGLFSSAPAKAEDGNCFIPTAETTCPDDTTSDLSVFGEDPFPLFFGISSSGDGDPFPLSYYGYAFPISVFGVRFETGCVADVYIDGQHHVDFSNCADG